MAAPAISHLIGTTALITLIFLLPLFYTNVVDNIETDVIERELQEIADYTSNTIENLYFLVNSSKSLHVTSLEKELVYLPSEVENSIYILEIVPGTNVSLPYVHAELKNDNSVAVNSWLIPGLTVVSTNNIIESDQKNVVVGCSRDDNGVNVWIKSS
ncbi:MAG: hypothetical protein P8X91_03255 [Candidatus Bathyarchaeota archaeon]